MFGEFALVFKLIGLGVVLGIATRILAMLNKQEIADIAMIVTIVVALGLVVPKIINAFSKAMSVFNAF